MFGIGGFELLLIVVFVLLVFGPDKLPEIGKMVGRGIRMFNDARHEVESVVNTQILRPEDIEAFGTLTGKRPYTPRPKSPSPVQNAVTAQQELERRRADEAARIEEARTGVKPAASSPLATETAAADAAPGDGGAAKSLAVAEAEARAAEAAKRAAEAEMYAAEASLRAAEAEAAAAGIVAGQSE